MIRPVYHDKSWGSRDQLMLHIANLELYATTVEKQRDDLARSLLQVQRKMLDAERPTMASLISRCLGIKA